MGRQLRIEYPGAFYHVMSHGNGLQWIYQQPNHLNIFKYFIKDIVVKYKFQIHAIVLMRNHYHILLETPLGNLSKGMKKFNQEFAKMFNKLKGRKGSVFKDRYKAILIEKENYYWTVLKYICQNPLRKKIVAKCEDYDGSFLYWINRDDTLEYMYLDEIINRFSMEGNWKNNFYSWVNDEIIDEIKSDSKSINFIGNKGWLKKISDHIKNIKGDVKERKKYTEIKIDLDKLVKTNITFNDIDIKIFILNKLTSMTHTEISKMLNITSCGSSKQRLYMFKKKMKNNIILKKEVDLIIEKIIKNDF